MNIKLILCAGITALYGSSAQAATLCVHPAGNGGCKSTIQEAVNLAAADDTIKIKPGTYYEAVTIPGTKTGLTIKGSKKAIIDADNKGDGLYIDANDVTIMNLSINNAEGNGINVSVAADRAHIRGVYIRNPDDDCINVDGDSAIIEKNHLQACGIEGVDVDGDNMVISKNRITHAFIGIDVDDGDNAIVEKNDISNVRNAGIYINGNDAVITRNKIANTNQSGIDVSSDDATVSRNRVTHTNNNGIRVVGENPLVTRNRVAFFGEVGIEIDCSTCNSALLEANIAKLGNGGGSDHCFEVDADTNGTVVNKNLGQVCGNDGFYIDGSGDIQVTNNRSMDAGSLVIGDGFSVHGLGKKTLIKNLARGSADDGFDVTDDNEIEDTKHRLENNKAIDNSDDGFEIDLDANETTLLNNKAIRNIANGISLYSNDNIVTGNIAKQNREGFDFCDEGSGNTLSGNKFGSESAVCSPNP